MIDEQEPLGPDSDGDEDDNFMVTGHCTIQAGMSGDGELQWRWKNEEIESALLLGFLDVMHDEIKADILRQVQSDDWEEDD